MTRTYSEELRTGGKLMVGKSEWYIEYYLTDTHLSRSGEIFEIDGSLIDLYISALKNNFVEYLILKYSTPSEGIFEMTGKMGMVIRIGGCLDGVCLHSIYMPINDKRELSRIIDDYNYAKEKAKKIQKSLFN